MITDVLVEHSALVPVALLLIAVACVAVAVVLLRRGADRLLAVVAALALVPIVALTLVPGSAGAGGVTCSMQVFLPRLGSVELLANIALFFPAVFFAALATRRPAAMFVAGVVLSAAIEGVQALLPALGRACDTSDWAMNSIGAFAAAALAAITLVLANRTRAGRPPAMTR